MAAKKKKNINFIISALVILAGVFLYAFVLPKFQTEAATFRLLSTGETFTIGETFSMDIKIDSEDKSINGAQATLQFPADKIEVTKLDKTDSVFNLWLAEPSFDNQKGEIRFIAASISGFSGASLQVLKATFKVKGIGTADIVVSDGAITASDGSGTNVFSTSQGLGLRIVRSKAEIARPPEAGPVTEEALGFPAKPVVKVPLYPDSEKWYNFSGDFSASWDLPRSVSAVAVAVNTVANFNPTLTEGLFGHKNFSALADGVWYLHVRFKNNIGFGQTAHYKISIDSAPPAPFIVRSETDVKTDNPAPKIFFETTDQLSGIARYLVTVDGRSEIQSLATETTLPTLAPGRHGVKVIAFDAAANSTESSLEIEILPISSPSISSVRTEIYAGEGGLSVNGLALPDIKILINIKNELGTSVFSTEAFADQGGEWSINIDKPLKKGAYVMEATAEDSRGALSLPVSSSQINVRSRPFIIVDNLAIGPSASIIILILIFAISFTLGSWTRKVAKESRQRRILIAQRDVNSQLLNIRKDVGTLIEKHKDKEACTPKNIENEVNYILKKIDTNIVKNKEYILENIEDIG